MMPRSLAALCCYFALSCNQPAAPKPTAAAAAPSLSAPSALSPPPLVPELVNSSATDVPGLKVVTGSIRHVGLWGFSDLGVDLRAAKLRIVSAARGAPLFKLLPAGALAVVNGGYFESDFRPSTWLKQDGVELARKTDTSKGGLLALGKADVYLGNFAGLTFEPALAVQSHPLIVEPEGKSGIHRDDGRRAARTVACLKGSALHFIVISAPRGEGPTLFESAALLRESAPRGFGCTRALNLDGGPSSGVWFGPDVPARQREPAAPVAYGIAILPR
jgi:hypothetical protein